MASSSHRSLKYHVFLSFRGEDTRKTYVDHLYTALSNKSIFTYKDDKTLPRGDSIGPSLLKAIEGSLIAVIVFSENYANSSWCLDELAHIMKCRKERRLIVIPIFYKVDPSHVRKQEGNFGRAFAKTKCDDDKKKKLWKEAIVDASAITDASNIAGWVTHDLAHGYESEGIKLIVDTIFKRLFPLYPYINEKLVGMESRLKSLKSLLDIESGGVHMVGIWGIGGSGKTTLAHFAYRHFSHQFDRHCFIGKIREESAKRGLEKLQEEVLSSLLKTDEKVQSVEEGQHKIASFLSLSPVLIVLDDVVDDEQIEALAGSHEWFGDGSRIIITTRDEHVLIRDKVETYPVSLLPPDEAIQLLEKYALLKDKPPIEDYDTLSRRVLSYADGLPLALKVLGSLLRGKDKKGWESALDKMKNIPNPKIMDILKISYDGLEPNERELFLDIACFHRGNDVNHVMKILDACDFYPDIVVLRDKALITISDGMLEMHDLVQEMGHYVVRNQHPKKPEKHSRVWKTNEILDMCYNDSAMVKENNEIEAIKFSGNSSVFFKLVSNMKKLRLLLVDATEGAHDYSVQAVEAPTFLSNELKYIDYAYYPGSPFPAEFQPRKLVVLMLQHTLQKELWQGCKVLPQLKELYLEDADNLVSTPDFKGLPCLENLRLYQCDSLEEIHPSLGYRNSLVHVSVSYCEKLRSFPTIVSLKKLKTLEIDNCKELLEFPEIQASMDSLIKLYLRYVGIQVLPASSISKYCTNLILLKLEHCIHLKRIEGNFQALKQLENFNLNGLFNLEKLPSNLFNSECSLKRLDLSDCQLEDGKIPGDVGELLNLTELDLSGNNFSRLPFSLLKLTRLKLLNLQNCYDLLELPECPLSIAILTNGSNSLKSWKYHVFLSFRGEDSGKNYVAHLYKALSYRLIHTYKDDQTLSRGDSIGPSLLNAIEESQIAVIVFSENYPDSSWCLDELVHIMKCRDERGLMVLPVFYNVNPSDVRKLEGNFGRAFAKRNRDNSTKEESWKKAIVEACNLSGWEASQIANGHVAAGIKSSVDTISEKLFSLDEDVDEDLVGMKTRLQSLEALLDIESGGVHMVGIWGVGGSGKTTLSYSAYQKFSHQFQAHCFIGQIREGSKRHGLIKLQEKVLSTLFKKDVKVPSVVEGKHMIRRRLRRSNVLIVLDDVDYDDQVEALAGSHEWFGNGSRIIITTRDEHLLHRDKVKIYDVTLLLPIDASQLFSRHAVQEDRPPIEDYYTLLRCVVSYADGLPLALKVLGSLLRGKDKKGWERALEKMKNIPNPTIMDTLKISYDGLEPNERELFLDIACFHRGYPVDHAMEILDACKFYPDIGIKVLKEKAIITISDGRFEMHKLVQEMGHYIVRGQHPKNPEKHSRVWKDEEIVKMCSTESARENNEIEAIRFNGWSSGFSKLVSNMKKLRLLSVHAIEGADNYSDQDVEGPSFLSNELQYVSYAHYPGSPFPADFHPTKLVVLKLQHTLQKELWKGYKLLPMLKVLHVEHAENLVRTPDFGGFPCLEKLSLIGCYNLEEIDPSLGYCKSLKRLNLSECQLEDGKIPGKVGELLNLTELDLSGNNFSQLPFSLLQLTRLELLDIRRCPKLLDLPELPSTVTTLVGSE